MERKIGEIFEFGGEWYQCVEGAGCYQCAFNRDENTCTADNPHCTCRSDKKDVVFKKLEKVGDPKIINGKKVQLLKSKYCKNCAFWDHNGCSFTTYPRICMGGEYGVYVEIKQNKEDMEDNKLNLKPFDIQKAREGKPVCTRDGRKARIICFDRICGDDYYKIVACVTAFDGDFEEVLSYGIDGYIVDSQNPKDEDLMMLPEKKEGWVNVYREESNNNERLIEQTIYKTRKDAFDNACPKGYITTTKINWEE